MKDLNEPATSSFGNVCLFVGFLMGVWVGAVVASSLDSGKAEAETAVPARF